ncbi:MAG: TldD/PmbA family protein, partial [Bacteroidales bacterium]|nr:TldD/PmbA family protein [Bacteroidales bacterium]
AAARAAAAITAGCAIGGDRRTSDHRHFGRPNPAADRYPMREDWRTSDVSAHLPLLQKLESLIRAKDTRVVKVIAMLSSQVSDILTFNSFEEMKYDTRPMGSLVASVVFSQGDAIETKSVSRSFRMGAEMLDGALLEELACQAVEGIDERFTARRPKGGRMPVVMGAGASGILLHEAMGHAFEADFNRKGQSVFSDKMGSRICRKGITIVDDGTIRGNRGAVNFDDEGVPGQYTVMVEDGLLTSYLHDRISAKYYGVAPTGNGRRESFRYNPIPRMRATYMESGEGTAADIIASVKKGIYVDQFANGQVKIGEGDFTFYVKSGFLIEDGRLTMPVKDVNIIGNGPQALADIEAVADDLKIDNGTWTCGKEQSVPVSCGIPTVLVNNLTVGGE